MRGMIRDLMRYHALQFQTAAERVPQARAMLDFLARGSDENSAYGKLLRSELELLRSAPDYYIVHEHLNDLNEPIYFYEFVERARRHGLQYLADADVTTMMASRFAPQVAETIRRISPDVIRQEQLMDFLCNRTFRQTLLVHAEQPVDRQITAQRMKNLWVSSPARPASANPNLTEGVVEKFCTPAGMCVNTPSALTKSAFVALAARSPAAIAVSDLVASVYSRLNPLAGKPPGEDTFEALANDLLQSYALAWSSCTSVHRRSPSSPARGRSPVHWRVIKPSAEGVSPHCATNRSSFPMRSAR
jgi:hypothetical protein